MSLCGSSRGLRVLLIYSNRARTMEPAPPIGLSYVASAAERAGHEVRLLDLMVSRNPHGELAAALRRFRPQVVGISIRNIDNLIAQQASPDLDQVQAIVQSVRRECSAPIVLGGPAATILGKALLERLDADFVVVGEGEGVFPRLLEAIASSGESGGQEGHRSGDNPDPFSSLGGVCYRRNGQVLGSDPVRETTFGASGMERWIQWRPYERAGGTWAIQSKRGCPMECSYCVYPSIEGRRSRLRAPGDVVDEIQRVAAAVGPRTFEFIDSAFNIPPRHAMDICREIIRRKLRVNLSAVSINPLHASKELFALMKEAGFCFAIISPDAASKTMLEKLRKGFDVSHVQAAAEAAKQSGIRCAWFFLLGGPGETRETVEETVSFVETHLNCRQFLSIFLIGVRLLTGSTLTAEAVEERVIALDQDLSRPVFYFSPLVEESWLIGRVNRAILRCPGIVQGAEQNGSLLERAFNRALYWMGVNPPHYRFLGDLLRLPPIPTMRARRMRGA